MIFVKGGILTHLYHWTHPKVPLEDIPYWWRRSLLTEIGHILRKWLCQVVAPHCVLTPVRMAIYRLCGFRIGKGTFIGVKCYLDDLCVDKMEIGEDVTISYGVYFALHGPGQDHRRLVIGKGAYIGMHASIVARQDLEIGEGAVVGAMTLVNRSIPAHATAVGVPCRVIRQEAAPEDTGTSTASLPPHGNQDRMSDWTYREAKRENGSRTRGEARRKRATQGHPKTR